MDIESFRLTDQEVRILQEAQVLSAEEEERVWHVNQAQDLLGRVSTAAARLQDLDPSSHPAGVQRNEILNRMYQDGTALSRMAMQLAPYASEGLGEQLEQFLRDNPS